jgi:hypothetical protein
MHHMHCTKCDGTIMVKEDAECIRCGKVYYLLNKPPRKKRVKNCPTDRLRYCGGEERLKEKVVDIWVEYKQTNGTVLKDYALYYVVNCPWCEKEMANNNKIVQYFKNDSNKEIKYLKFTCSKNHRITVQESRAEGMIAWR